MPQEASARPHAAPRRSLLRAVAAFGAVIPALLPALVGTVVGVSLGGMSPRVAAQPVWPTKPVRLVIPFPAGGATDIIGRTVAARLGVALGQQVIVENRPGAGGTIGSDAVAKSAPDGYTLLMATSSTHSIGPALNPKMPYDAVRDFAPVAHIANAPSVLVVGRDSPARTAPELIAMLKRNPGRYNFGSSGIGTYPHLSAEMFKWRAGGLFVVHIPYRGTGLVITDLVAGQIAFLMDSIVSAQSHIRDGKIRALAVTGARRSTSLPSVPTFTELGIPGMEFSNWFGVFAPAGTPPDIVQRLNRELNAVMRSPEVLERLERAGADAAGGTPEQFARVYRDEFESWKAVIQRANIKPE
ncbi:MAG TPA: tripartite tricarboxylate transporter substrate binding protein [Quisquiliibacterium sp.]|nr:tripartite tricarboxylate transporter substrate binding protein [Quisquiliibacterium sp.]